MWCSMKQIILVPLGHQTTRAPQTLTHPGRRQMGLVGEMLRQRVGAQRPLLVCNTSEVSIQSRRIIADALEFTDDMESELFETFEFIRLNDPMSLRVMIAYLKRHLENNSQQVIVLLVHNSSIPELDPAIQHLLWDHSTVDPKRCDPGHFLVYDPIEGSPVLH